MKRILLYFAICLMISGCGDFGSTRFTPENFSIKPVDDENFSGLFIKFTMKEDISPARPFDVYPVVYNSDNKEIYRAAKPVKVKVISLIDSENPSQKVKLAIPFCELDLPAGSNDITIYFAVKDAVKDYGLTKEGVKTTIEMPEFISYSQIKFSAQKSVFKVGKSAINLKFNLSSTLTSKDIKYTTSKPENRFVFIKTEVWSADGSNLFKDCGGENRFEIPLDKKLTDCDLNIPMKNFALKCGSYDIVIKIYAESLDSLTVSTKLTEKKLHINMPQFFKTEFKVSNLKADKSNKYDQKIKYNINQRLSDFGKGKPDLYFTLKSGGSIFYQSEVHKNSYEIANSQAATEIIKGEDLIFTVYDQDPVIKDKVLGVFRINSIMHEDTITYTNKNFGSITADFNLIIRKIN